MQLGFLRVRFVWGKKEKDKLQYIFELKDLTEKIQLFTRIFININSKEATVSHGEK